MVSNNIRNYIFSVGLLVFMLQQSIQRHAYKASFLAHVIIVHSVFGPINGPMSVKGLRYVGVLCRCVFLIIIG